MLTRLQVKGFKNLLDVDVQFGPFTCIAGPNGVGKSNLFDAILFLSEIASKPFVEAASSIRGGDESPSGLFPAHGEKKMFLAAEMLIPQEGQDAFSQRAKASASFVRYEVELRLEEATDSRLKERIRLEREKLSYIRKGDAREALGFSHAPKWRDSVVHVKRSTPFISTTTERGVSVVNLHADRMKAPEKARRGGGKPVSFPVATLPRTALSSAQYADETRTAVLVREEMSNWRLLQLEPSSMREQDNFQSQDIMATTGAHIPATLYRIAADGGDQEKQGAVYAEVANRLAELVEGVKRVRVDRDDTRRVLTLMMTDLYGLELPASALSDGTMRFIALAVLQKDPRETGLVCLEEPENGIHPQRIEAILKLLNDIAVDPFHPIDEENPLRQVIINTHSPLIAGRVAEECLLFARGRSKRVRRKRIPEMALSCLDSTWRTNAGMETISIGGVLMYLRGAAPSDEEEDHTVSKRSKRRRVIDRFHPDQLSLFPNNLGARE